MSVALDLGSHTFRALRRDGNELVARRCRSAYSILPDQGTQRHLLERAGIPYAACEGNLVLLGDASDELSRLFQVPCIPLLPGGAVPAHDPVARQVCSLLVDTLLPAARYPEEICCITHAVNRQQQQAETTDAEEFFTGLIRLRGYNPQVLNSGMALIFAELGAQRFTGFGLVLGAASCEVSLAFRGREILSCSISRGGHWIDEQMARAAGVYGWDSFGNKLLDVDKVSRDKEATHQSLLAPVSREEKLLAHLYRELVNAIVQELVEFLVTEPRALDLPGPLPIVVGGGAARMPGFAELLQEQLAQSQFPMDLQPVRLANDSPYTIARGCLINAELETQTKLTQRRLSA